MTTEDLYHYMDNPQLLSKETLPELKQIVDAYPWFHIARLLYLKNLSLLEEITFPQQLKQMSVSVPDRKRLFLLIEGDKYGVRWEPDVAHKEDSEDTFSLIDSFLSSQASPEEASAAEPQLRIDPSVSSDYIYWSLSKGLISDEKEVATPLQHQDLIDSFIEQDENRKPGGLADYSADAPASGSSDITDNAEGDNAYLQLLDESYFTETLARIYIKQHRYDKALQIIKKLSLKYPEKNVYFADQIRFLEKLIINTKKLY